MTYDQIIDNFNHLYSRANEEFLFKDCYYTFYSRIKYKEYSGIIHVTRILKEKEILQENIYDIDNWCFVSSDNNINDILYDDLLEHLREDKFIKVIEDKYQVL